MGVNVTITYIELFLDDRVYIKISVNHGYGMNVNAT